MDSNALEEQFWNSLSLAVDTDSVSLSSMDSFDEEDLPASERRALPSMSPNGRKLRKKWGTRKNQRYLNDTSIGNGLHQKSKKGGEDDSDEEEPDQLFEWKSTFASLTQPYSPQSRVWEPFIDIKEEQQTLLIRKLSSPNGGNGDDNDHYQSSVGQLSTSVPGQFYHHHTPTRRRPKVPRLDRHTKRLLHKSVDSPIVQRLEVCLSRFAGGRELPEQDASFGFRHETSQNHTFLLLYFEDDPTGFQRLLAHAVSTFFGLLSKSEVDQNEQKFVLIQRTKSTFVPPVSLSRYITMTTPDPTSPVSL